MKLQKNNKYVKRLTAGLGAVILSASILAGCGASKNTEPVETTMAVEEPSPTSKILDLSRTNYYYETIINMSEEEYNTRMEELNLKYPNALNEMSKVSTIVVKNKEDGKFKILQVLENWNFDEQIIHFYDLFTEAFLFDLSYNDINKFTVEDCVFNNIDMSKAYNKISYFDENEIFKYGMCCYSTYFTYYNIDLLREQEGVKYGSLDGRSITYMYPLQFSDSDLKFTTKEIADNYIKTVPRNLQVNAKELGVEITYPEERKYADFWKISDEEREKRYNSLEVLNENEKTTMDKTFTLILLDKDNNYKELSVFYQRKEGTLKFYNIFTNEYLFTLSGNDIGDYDYDNKYFKISNDSKLIDIIPYFADKTIIKLDAPMGMNNFIYEMIDEYSKRDGIEYEYPGSEWANYLFPPRDFQTNELEFSIKEIGEAYVTIVPREMQITAEELSIGMTSEKDKVLIK